MAPARDILFQMFGPPMESSTACVPSTFRKVFTSGERYVYELPGGTDRAKDRPLDRRPR